MTTELCCSFRSKEPERSSYSEHNEDRDGRCVCWRHKVFAPLQRKAARPGFKRQEGTCAGEAQERRVKSK